LRTLGDGLFSEEDLRTVQADWVQPLSLVAFDRRLWTIPPNSQGYLALAGAWIADQVGVPEDPDDDAWAFVLVEAARQAAHDRVAVLHDRADGAALLSPGRLGPRAAAIRAQAGRGLADVYRDGDTTYLCAVDADRAGVSLIMSNAASFGSHLMLSERGIFLHNRGMGFSVQEGHPAELGPGRRPPHTLSPLAVTRDDGALDAVIGSMGGDAQPQIVLQLLARTLITGEDAGTAVGAPRWSLTREASTGFDVWETSEPPIVALEHDAPAAWQDGMLCGAADPRPRDGACVGL
jgi:gamma-glutamyltranspeptidase/glutathione hydrolase